MPSPRRDRERRPGRRPPFRDPKPIMLIVCEGARTEPEYFNGFARACRNPRVQVKIAREHGVPATLVAIAKEYKRRAETDAKRQRDENLAYDSVWCVFDVDDHPNVPNAKQTARDNDIELAISNPCFELWLLLHFRDSPGMQHRAKIQQMLLNYVPDYNKRVDFTAYLARYPQAVERAERMDKQADGARDAGCNPTTGVYKLTTAIEAAATQ